MNGGTFIKGQEKERPGIYFNFTEKANDRISSGERGRVAIPLALSWGKSKEIIEIHSESDAINKLGVDINDPSLLLLREAKKNASRVLVYRVNEGEKAKGTVGVGLTLTAKYGGLKGNNVSVSVAKNVLVTTEKDVTTYFENKEVDKQTVKDSSELISNNYVVFSGTGDPEVSVGVKLTGGDDGTAEVAAYTAFLAALETENFNVAALPVEEEELKATFASFIRRLREDQGVKVQGVLSGHAANYEGIINVANGIILESGKALSAEQAVAWVAGASAGATLKQSNTFAQYEGAVDVSPRYDHDETVSRLRKGEFLFTFDGRDKSVTVEKDQNSLASNAKFSQNKVIRIMDAFHKDVFNSLKDIIRNRKSTGEDIPVDEDGKSIVHTAVVLYGNTLQDDNVLTNFAQEDVLVEFAGAGDGFLINVAIQPVGSAEKFYFDAVVS